MGFSPENLQKPTYLRVTSFVAEFHHKDPSNLPEKATIASWLSLAYTGAPILLSTSYEKVYSIHSQASWPYYAANEHELSITGFLQRKATLNCQSSKITGASARLIQRRPPFLDITFVAQLQGDITETYPLNDT